jgi:hypothetical protein
MPRYHSRNCDYCGAFYTGAGKKYCNTICFGKANTQDINIRFWSKVNIKSESECWEWTKSKDKYGYGQFAIKGGMTKSPRIAWALTYGDIPNKKCICHNCDNPSCCNPAHLFVGTHQDNAQDRLSKGRQSRLFGISNPACKLSNEQVLTIIKLYETGTVFQRELAIIFGVSRSRIGAIVTMSKKEQGASQGNT